jgi:hypothetical protein
MSRACCWTPASRRTPNPAEARRAKKDPRRGCQGRVSNPGPKPKPARRAARLDVACLGRPDATSRPSRTLCREPDRAATLQIDAFLGSSYFSGAPLFSVDVGGPYSGSGRRHCLAPRRSPSDWRRNGLPDITSRCPCPRGFPGACRHTVRLQECWPRAMPLVDSRSTGTNCAAQRGRPEIGAIAGD